MKLANDGTGWVPGQSGVDPNIGVGQSITVPPLVPHNAADCFEDTLATLNSLNNLYQKGIDAIEGFIAAKIRAYLQQPIASSKDCNTMLLFDRHVPIHFPAQFICTVGIIEIPS
jgi:hypothetical protein